MPNLTANFTLEEMVRSEVAMRRNIRNTTSDPVIIAALTAVAQNIMEPVRAHFNVGFTPNSAYRCPALNAAIGSKPTSQHVRGQAVDIEVPGIGNFDLARWIEANLDFDQLILEMYVSGQPSSGWVHCSYVAPGANRHQTLTTANGANFQPGLHA